MNAKQAEELALSRQDKFEKRVAKHVKKDMNFIHKQIKIESKRGYFAIRWDYRDSLDKAAIKSNLIEEGYTIVEYYPYFEIVWGNENEVCHKKFK